MALARHGGRLSREHRGLHRALDRGGAGWPYLAPMSGSGSTPRPRLGLALAGIAGYTDAAAFVSLLGVFVSHMSGSTTRLAVELGCAHWHQAMPFVIVIVGFTAGAFAEQMCLSFHPQALLSLLVAEAGLLLAVAAAGLLLGHENGLTESVSDGSCSVGSRRSRWAHRRRPCTGQQAST